MTEMTDEFRKELELIIMRQKRRIDRLVKMVQDRDEVIDELRKEVGEQAKM